MSAKYVSVLWKPNKWVYDADFLFVFALYFTAFLQFCAERADGSHPAHGVILRMRVFGIATFILLSEILYTGSLARMHACLLPLLLEAKT